MQIATILSYLESIAPLAYQENYDNAGLLTGSGDWECSGVLTTLDATEAVVQEAISRGANLIVAHHPIIFSGLKKINGRNYIEKTVIAAIKHDIAIYAIHTNLDNVMAEGVNGRMAAQLGLVNSRPLLPKESTLQKLFCFVPTTHLEPVRNAIFAAGAGHIGGYTECSFSSEGMGTFKGGPDSQPFVGQPGIRHEEAETRVEAILPAHLSRRVVTAMIAAHPYEEVAYDLVNLANNHALDYGTAGHAQTEATLTSAGVRFTGPPGAPTASGGARRARSNRRPARRWPWRPGRCPRCGRSPGSAGRCCGGVLRARCRPRWKRSAMPDSSTALAAPARSRR